MFLSFIDSSNKNFKKLMRVVGRVVFLYKNAIHKEHKSHFYDLNFSAFRGVLLITFPSEAPCFVRGRLLIGGSKASFEISPLISWVPRSLKINKQEKLIILLRGRNWRIGSLHVSITRALSHSKIPASSCWKEEKFSPFPNWVFFQFAPYQFNNLPRVYFAPFGKFCRILPSHFSMNHHFRFYNPAAATGISLIWSSRTFYAICVKNHEGWM